MERRKQPLELSWAGKDERPSLGACTLVEIAGGGHLAAGAASGAGLIDNRLVHGDNLAALQALQAEFAGQATCVYVDPPYNTGSRFAQFEDGLEHAGWLAMMRDRLEGLRSLLAAAGSCWVQLDDNEVHYCRVLMDEIFGRRNFIANIVWNKSYAVRSNAQFFSTAHEHILVYAKDRERFSPNRFRRTHRQETRYGNPDSDPRGPWQSVTLTVSLVGGARGRHYARTGVSENIFEAMSPSGKSFMPPPNRCWSRSRQGLAALERDKRIWWGPNGDRAPRLKLFLSEQPDGILPTTLWADGEEFGFNQQGVRELRALGLPDFPTPKPERLISKVLEIASGPGDLVVDAFAGSGTTGAVAHKMGRRWIMVEVGSHCHSHIVPRLRKVVDGEDPGGITKSVGWTGGGGFRLYGAAPSVARSSATAT